MRLRINPPRRPDRSAIGSERPAGCTGASGGAKAAEMAVVDGGSGGSLDTDAEVPPTDSPPGGSGGAEGGTNAANSTAMGFFAASAYFAGPNSIRPASVPLAHDGVALRRTAVGGSQEVSVQVWKPMTISAPPAAIAVGRRSSKVTGPSTPLAAANSAA